MIAVRSLLGCSVLTVITWCLPTSEAAAIPATTTASDSNDDADLTVVVSTQRIVGDAATRCTLRVEVRSGAAPLTAGDRVTLQLDEVDGGTSEPFFTTTFTINAAELAAGAIDRSFLCGGSFPDFDGDSSLEVRAEAFIYTCGTSCAPDILATTIIPVALVNDDAAEQDDSPPAATVLDAGGSGDRIARDSDWSRIMLASPARVEVRVAHDPSGGRLDADLRAMGGAVVAAALDESSGSFLTTPILAAGSYDLHVRARAPNDFNFYDLEMIVTPFACVPGGSEAEACGACGSRTRGCDPSGAWMSFGACEGEGACSAGATRSLPCGMCGARTETCDASCAWVAEACAGEGECAAGEVGTRSCAFGPMQSRTCRADCSWGPYSTCDVAPDGGLADAGRREDGGGSMDSDAATLPSGDGGASMRDAAGPSGDAGAPPADARDGCACRSGTSGPPGRRGSVAVLTLLAWCLVCTRRRAHGAERAVTPR